MLLQRNKAMQGVVHITPVNLRFGYSDFSLVKNSLTAITPPSLGSEEKEAKIEQKEKQDMEEKKEKQDVEEKHAVRRISVINDREMEQDLQQKQRLERICDTSSTNFGELSFNIEMSNVQLLVVNDATSVSVPVARALIKPIKTIFNSYQQRMSVRIGFELSADYFNTDIVEWEPMIEPWGFSTNLFIYPYSLTLQFLPTHFFKCESHSCDD
ncbi:hypothetical protein RFI_00799 [Reticulomyxa filosa]|uniref:VPS13-like middle region domain-containing protein n=1 Tax=Reticulomyxa filosa TaxID=46433 RepID=X6PDI3_RETFI|nr:hypothetical protein RFI_00799 [Reticulomyxa filosa]|eukprot:ETO36266.1 hypothetical protein RFI_00799 [Reticulomyxa filosa]